MIKPGPVFTRPRTPAAKCLHLVRLNPIITRSELVEATGLSQPTITRATTALLNAGLIQERTDLTQSQGRGRPTVPLEAADNNWVLGGIAVGTSETYIGLYDIKGRTISEEEIATPVARLTEEDFLEHIMAGINRMMTGLDRRLVALGITTSGTVDEEGLVTADNLGWHGVDIAARLRFQFSVPVVVTSAISAILGSETQAAEIGTNERVLLLFADDSLGSALSADDEVNSIIPLPQTRSDLLGHGASEHLLATQSILEAVRRHGIQANTLPEVATIAESNSAVRAILDERARQLGQITAEMVNEYSPKTVVIAGGAFTGDSRAPQLFASTVRDSASEDLELRMIPSHKEIVRAVARTVATDQLLREPLELGRSLQTA
ncbi:ROK family transcriptional regulator [Corynebacterium sp. KPL2830]|uniref:ROK family transcriptional regulator n=1 Tax=unclassified Corynebacterium TaxID=2624378 RepID=UPI00254A1371|nr:ROK family transcriptional regulator [Corynebacterium sp. MSK204]MDK8659869.1 ROK family transcriptional regulator [Corynebacterium sp. MSK204]